MKYKVEVNMARLNKNKDPNSEAETEASKRLNIGKRFALFERKTRKVSMHLNFGNIFSQQNVQTILYLTPCVFQHLE
jgi:hypothetical protein